jgi:hypothetical protein
MSQANRTMMRAIPQTVLLAASTLLAAAPAAAQPPADPFAAEPAPDAPTAEPPASHGPLPPPRPAFAPFTPPPADRDPMGQPPAPQLTEGPKPQLSESEGPVASWDPLRFAIGIESRTTWPMQDAARRLAGQRAPTGGGLCLQADAYRPSEQVALRLDLGWTSTSTSSFQVGSSLSEKLDTMVVQLGASARYHVFPWLAPFVRLAGGLGRDQLTVAELHDRQWWEQVSAGAGLFLRSPSLRLWQSRWFAPLLGLMGTVEGGYALATASDFSMRPSPSSSAANPIPGNQVALGHVERGAPYLRASLGLAF